MKDYIDEKIAKLPMEYLQVLHGIIEYTNKEYDTFFEIKSNPIFDDVLKDFFLSMSFANIISAQQAQSFHLDGVDSNAFLRILNNASRESLDKSKREFKDFYSYLYYNEDELNWFQKFIKKILPDKNIRFVLKSLFSIELNSSDKDEVQCYQIDSLFIFVAMTVIEQIRPLKYLNKADYPQPWL